MARRGSTRKKGQIGGSRVDDRAGKSTQNTV